MHILVTGATGVLGRRLVDVLSTSGHSVIGLTRDERGDEIVTQAGGQPSRANLFNPDEVTHAAAGVDAIIHAATAIPKKARPSGKDWQLNDEIRINGTRSLIEVMQRVGAKHLIFQSIVWLARPADNAPFDEDDRPTPDEVTRSSYVAEQMAIGAAQQYGFTATVLRGGWLYAPDAWHMQTFGEAIWRRRLPIIGSGEASWSILHADDAATAYLATLNQQPSGIYHVVDDHPVQVREFFSGLAERLGARPPMRVPVWLARIAAGSYSTEFVTRSMITSNRRFKDATGWRPAYPSYRDGLDHVVKCWERDGFPWS